MKIHNPTMFISMSIDGEKSAPFSGTTLRMPDPAEDLTTQIVAQSRERFARPRSEVEQEITRWTNSALPDTDAEVMTDETSEPVNEQKPNTFLAGLSNPSTTTQSPRTEHSRPVGQTTVKHGQYQSQTFRPNNQPTREQEPNKPQPATVGASNHNELTAGETAELHK